MRQKPDLEDEDLALMAGLGDRAAFEALLHKYAAGVAAVLRQRVRDSHLAEDLAQEVWIKVYGALGAFRAGGAFRAWLFAIALNHSRDALRSRGRDRLRSLDSHWPEGVDGGGGGESGASAGPYRGATAEQSPSRPLERVDEARLVDEALGAVREPFRSALALVDLGGLSYAEAAGASGCNVGTLKSRVHRARVLFREAFLRREPGGPGKRSDVTIRQAQRSSRRTTP